MRKKCDYPIVVIGAGAGGLVVAIGAAKAGKKVLLIEKGNYGGDCTNFGCIPSKSLIAAAHAAHVIKNSRNYGIELTSLSMQCEEALERTRRIVKEVRSHEEPEALAKVGVETLTGCASFVDPHTLKVARRQEGNALNITGEQIVIATGSSPSIPKISGLQECHFCTNETIFALKTIPKRLGVIGGGPIGCELAHAFQRLGSAVTLIHHHDHLLTREEPESQHVIEQIFRQEGIQLKLNTEPLEANALPNGTVRVRLLHNDAEDIIEVDNLLVSSGRRPNIEELNLDAIGVHTHKRGITVDRYGRTPQHKHIWAVGDVAGHAMFTHVAENEGRSVLANLLLPWPFKKKLDTQAIPRVTYTDPEIASVGLNEQTAIERYGKKKIATYIVPFSEVDRAITTGRTEGFAKIVTKKWSGTILGATIVAPRGGDMLSELTTAMREGIPLRKLATLIHPYPTYSLAIRKAADQWLTKTILPRFTS